MYSNVILTIGNEPRGSGLSFELILAWNSWFTKGCRDRSGSVTRLGHFLGVSYGVQKALPQQGD